MSKITHVISPNVDEPRAGTWSNCLVVNGIAYLSGFTARSSDFKSIEGDDEYSQAKAVFQKMRHMLEAAGGSMQDIVKLTIFVTDITKRERVWAARKEFFKDPFPACSLVQVAALAAPVVKVEIEGVAHLGASSA